MGTRQVRASQRVPGRASQRVPVRACKIEDLDSDALEQKSELYLMHVETWEALEAVQYSAPLFQSVISHN